MAKNKDIIDSAASEIPTGYVTLKEAASLTDYTPDYIGQLVRAGKIEGRQVYSNVAWVASEESLQKYLAAKGKDAPELAHAHEFDLPDFARPLLYLVILCSAMLLIILIHVFSVTIDRAISSSFDETTTDIPTKNL